MPAPSKHWQRDNARLQQARPIINEAKLRPAADKLVAAYHKDYPGINKPWRLHATVSARHGFEPLPNIEGINRYLSERYKIMLRRIAKESSILPATELACAYLEQEPSYHYMNEAFSNISLAPATGIESASLSVPEKYWSQGYTGASASEADFEALKDYSLESLFGTPPQDLLGPQAGQDTTLETDFEAPEDYSLESPFGILHHFKSGFPWPA
jgi:hypothetical protein